MERDDHLGAHLQGQWQPNVQKLPGTPADGVMVELLGASVLARWEFPEARAYRVGWGGHLAVLDADGREVASFAQHTAVQSMDSARTGLIRSGGRALGAHEPL